MEKWAEMAKPHGIEKVAIVADGIKSLAAKSRVETTELEVFTTEDQAEAVEWINE